MLHLIHVFMQRFCFGPAAQYSQLQLETRKNSAQIMRHTRKQSGALIHMPRNAPLHIQESFTGRPHFCCAFWLEAANFAALAKFLRRSCQIQNGLHLIAQEHHGNGQKDQSGQRHEQQEQRCSHSLRAICAHG